MPSLHDKYIVFSCLFHIHSYTIGFLVVIIRESILVSPGRYVVLTNFSEFLGYLRTISHSAIVAMLDCLESFSSKAT